MEEKVKVSRPGVQMGGPNATRPVFVCHGREPGEVVSGNPSDGRKPGNVVGRHKGRLSTGAAEAEDICQTTQGVRTSLGR